MKHLQQLVMIFVLFGLLIGCQPTPTPPDTPKAAPPVSAADQALHAQQTADAQAATAAALKAAILTPTATSPVQQPPLPPPEVFTPRPPAPPALSPQAQAALTIFNLPAFIKDTHGFIWRSSVQGKLQEKDWAPGVKEAGATAAYRAFASTADAKTDPYRFWVTAYDPPDPNGVLNALQAYARSQLTDIQIYTTTNNFTDTIGFNGIFTSSGQKFDETYEYKVFGSTVVEAHVEGPFQTPEQRHENTIFIKDRLIFWGAYGEASVKIVALDTANRVANPPPLLPQVGTLKITPSGLMLSQVFFGSTEKANSVAPGAQWVELALLQPTDANDSLLNGQVGRVRFPNIPSNNVQQMFEYINQSLNLSNPTISTQNQILPGMQEAVSNSTYNSIYTYVWPTGNDLDFAWFVRQPKTPNVEKANADIISQIGR